MPRFTAAFVLLLLLLALPLRAEEALDIDAFCKSLTGAPPKVDLVEERVYQQSKEHGILAIAMSADLSRIAATDDGGHVCVWDAKSSKLIAKLEEEAPFASVAITSDGKFVLAGSSQGGGWVIDADTGKRTFLHDAPKGRVKQAIISSDDKWALMVTDKDTIHRYPLHGGQGITSSQKEPAKIGYLGYTPDTSAVVYCPKQQAKAVVVQFPDSAEPPVDITLPFPEQLKPTQILAIKPYVTFAMPGQLVAYSLPSASDMTFAISQMPSRLRTMKWSCATPDERWLMFGSIDGALEMRPAIAPGCPRVFHVPIEEPRAMTMAADGRTILVGDSEGTIHALRLTAESATQIQTVGLTLQKLLQEERYLELDAIAQHFERDTKPLAWAPNQTPFCVLCDLLVSNLGRPVDRRPIDEKLDLWIERRPDAKLPRLVRAERYIQTAWQKRGGGVAAVVTREGWKGFHEDIAKARELVEPIAEEQKPVPAAYRLVAIVGMAESWDDERMKSYQDRLLDEAPEFIEAHAAFMQALMPRWGGAPEDCHNYAARVADKIGGGTGDGIYARLAITQRRYYDDRSFCEQTKLDADRVKRGLLYLAEHATDAQWARHTGLRFTYYRTDRPGASQFAALLKTPEMENDWDANWWNHYQQVDHALQYAKE